MRFNTKEAAEFIGYSESTLINWRHDKDKNSPMYYKPMGKVFYFKDDLALWLAGTGGKLREEKV